MAFSRKFPFFAFIFQLVMFILFFFFVTYHEQADCHEESHHCATTYKWSMFVHVHFMIFIGFGFLMVFLKNYGYGAISINLLISVFTIEWAILVGGFFRMAEHHNKIPLSIFSMFEADFTAATTLISFGAVLGRISPLQSLLLIMFEVPLAFCNIYLNEKVFGANDIGGSFVVHIFGAYFGLAVCLVLYFKSGVEKVDHKNTADKTSDLFSMIGTLFLWICWPSFNAAIATEVDAQNRAVLNTYIGLCGGTMATFMVSALSDSKNKFSMVHMQNATLAAGVAIGAVANLRIEPWGALLLGFSGGLVSTIGYAYIQPWLKQSMRLYDVCGVHNLHGMPGVVSAIASIVLAALQTSEKSYGFDLGDRSGRDQALYQLALLGTTLGISIVGGLLTGLVMMAPFFDPPHVDDIYEDEPYFNIESHEYEVNVNENDDMAYNTKI